MFLQGKPIEGTVHLPSPKDVILNQNDGNLKNVLRD